MTFYFLVLTKTGVGSSSHAPRNIASFAKKRRLDDDYEDNSGFIVSDSECDAKPTESSCGNDNSNEDSAYFFKPPYTMGQWENDKWEKRISVAILMPSGTCNSTSDHDVRVVDDGKALEVSVKWPRSLTDPNFLHSIWTNDSSETTRIEGATRAASFRPFIRSLRNNSSQAIVSRYKIILPTTVKTDNSLTREDRRTYLRPRATSEIVLYVTLEAPEKEYHVENTSTIKIHEI